MAQGALRRGGGAAPAQQHYRNVLPVCTGERLAEGDAVGQAFEIEPDDPHPLVVEDRIDGVGGVDDRLIADAQRVAHGVGALGVGDPEQDRAALRDDGHPRPAHRFEVV